MGIYSSALASGQYIHWAFSQYVWGMHDELPYEGCKKRKTKRTPPTNVVLRIQTLGIPQGRHKSCSLYDNLTIHNSISRLTATYADVRGSAALCWIEPSLKSVQQAGHIGIGCLLWIKCWNAVLHDALNSMTHLASNSLWWIGPDWTSSHLSHPCHLQKIGDLLSQLDWILWLRRRQTRCFPSVSCPSKTR